MSKFYPCVKVVISFVIFEFLLGGEMTIAQIGLSQVSAPDSRLSTQWQWRAGCAGHSKRFYTREADLSLESAALDTLVYTWIE